MHHCDVDFLCGVSIKDWACSQRSESCSESHFGSWFWPFPDLKAWFYPLGTQSSFKSGFWNAKKGVLDRDLPRKHDSEDLWIMQSSFGMWFVHGHFEAMHGSICATIYYIAMRRFCSWSGRRLQCSWAHVHSSNHERNQEADLHLKWLLWRASLWLAQRPAVPRWCPYVLLYQMWIGRTQRAHKQGLRSEAAVQNVKMCVCLLNPPSGVRLYAGFFQGGTLSLFISASKFWGQFSRHRIFQNYTLYITNLSNKKKKKEKKSGSKGGGGLKFEPL